MTGVRVCLKELYGTKYDPLSISYTVLSGTDKENALSVLILTFSTMYDFWGHVVLSLDIFQIYKKEKWNL